MKILALDISSKNTGWCILLNSLILDKGEIAGDPNHIHPSKLKTYREKLDAIISTHKPDLIAIEDAWSGKNKLTFKILAYYHGVTLELSGTHSVPLSVMMPSRFRRIVGAAHNTKLNFADRESAKNATGELVRRLGLASATDSEDICDSVAIAVAAELWHTKFKEHLDAEGKANPKIRSAKRLAELATKSTELHFKALEKANEKLVGRTGGR